jgi:cytochrome P450
MRDEQRGDEFATSACDVSRGKASFAPLTRPVSVTREARTRYTVYVPATDDVAAAVLPSLDLDPYSNEVLSDPYAAYQQIREAGPVVSLPRYGILALGRHHDVRRVLHDVHTFISSAGVGLTDLRSAPGVRSPSLVLEADPPAHTRPRAVLTRILSAEAIDVLRGSFRQVAERLVTGLLERGQIDAIADCARAFTLQVFPDAVGLGPEQRENLLGYAEHLFNANGPKNALFDASARDIEPLASWIMEHCQRSALRPGGFGDQIYQAEERGELDAHQAPLLVRSLLSAGVDTTIAAIGNTLHCLATHSEAWSRLHQTPALARHAFDEALRYDSPAPLTFRTTSVRTMIEGQVIPAGRKLLLLFGAANRDPRRWPEPDRFDIERRPTGHLAFGSGIHACVGQLLARVEAETLLEELARRVQRLELSGTPRRWLNNSVHAWGSLPLQLH